MASGKQKKVALPTIGIGRPLRKLLTLPYRTDTVSIMETFISTTEAAERLGVSSMRVRQLLQSGRLAGRKLLRDWLVSAASVAGHVPQPQGWPKGRPRKKSKKSCRTR